MSVSTKERLPEPWKTILDRGFELDDSFWKFQPGNFISSIEFDEISQKILDMEVREDDIWLASYPRTGSHWTQEMTWLIANDCNFEKASTVMQHLRSPMLENDVYMSRYREYLQENIPELLDNLTYVKKMSSPRFIKTHLPYEHLPIAFDKVRPKIIISIRSPKDIFPSYYHHLESFHHMKNISKEEFADLFLSGNTPVGGAADNFLSYWKRLDQPNILIVKYEDTKRDTRGTVKKIAEFLNKEISEEQIDKLIDFLSVENMRKNPAFNMEKITKSRRKDETDMSKHLFVRKGEVGDWKNELPESYVAKFDEYMKKLEKEGIIFE